MQKPATETVDSIFIAMDFVHKAHYGQYRKGTKIPYFIHPLGVAKILIDYDCSEEIIIAGLLHDTVEDTAVTIDEIERNFGEHVAEIVGNITEPEKSIHWEKRKQYQFDLIKKAPLEELFIICADKLDTYPVTEPDLKGKYIFSVISLPSSTLYLVTSVGIS